MNVSSSSLRVSVACLLVAALLFSRVEDRVAIAQDGAASASAEDEWTHQRKEAAHRKRRIIFNNDGCDAVYFCDKATPETLLESRTTALLGTQVDSIFYCTWCSGFSNFTHNTKIGHVFTRKEEQLSNNKVDQFLEQGTDPLKIMVDFCRKNEIEIFWSFRMNDTHDVSTAWYGPLLFPQLKKDHPDWLLGSREKPTKHGRWTGVDYGREEIRDLAFRFIQEVCENYDVDGVEFDFFRHLNYFKRVSMGEHAGPEEREMMTGLLRRVRKMTERIGRQRGRPILVAIRVPDSIEYCAAMGFDLVRWLEDDLIDLMAASGYFRLNPWETTVELGHKHGVPVYPCLSESRLKGETQKVRASVEGYRARAMNVWDSGADGVYLFNSFNPRSPLWSELGDPKKLTTMDKVYVTAARSVNNANSWLAGGTRFLNRSVLTPERPLTLKPGEAASVELQVGEQVSAPDAGRPAPNVELRLQVTGLTDPSDLAIKLNDQALTGGALSGEWLNYAVAPALVAKGVNHFQITLASTSEAKPVLRDLLLWVRYRKD
ncbi:MAG: family 10 glycosylhydrolase [Planctomycetota bacterium]